MDIAGKIAVITGASEGIGLAAARRLAAYASTKSALNMLSETARAELAPENIRVILVLPRATATNFGRNSLGDPEMRRRQRESDAPSGRSFPVDTADHVADRILSAIRDEPAEQLMTD